MNSSALHFMAPQQVLPTDFNLNKELANRKFAKELLKKKKETLEETDDTVLFRTGDNINGYFALYNKHDDLIEYLIKYKTSTRKAIGTAVTQVALWRLRGSPFVQGLTKRVFFDVLLARWPAIMSDREQTDDGKEFWENRMAEGTARGLNVGLLDEARGTITWHTGDKTTIRKWIESSGGWGDTHQFQNLRYVIANKV